MVLYESSSGYSSLSHLCASEEYEETHANTHIIISRMGRDFHSTTFESIKAKSPLVHRVYGLSPAAIVELANVVKVDRGINNHSYLRCCPELIFSFSNDLKQELLRLTDEQLCLLAIDGQKAVLLHYETEEPDKIAHYWYGWETVYELSHYTIEYFAQVLLNVFELLRYCAADESVYFSVDY